MKQFYYEADADLAAVAGQSVAGQSVAAMRRS
jgi:hypothetical protein